MRVFIAHNGDVMGQLLNVLGKKRLPGVNAAIKKAANLTKREWAKDIKHANSKQGWKNAYRRGLKITREGPMEATISVMGSSANKFANFVESGVKRWDIKWALLNGPKARRDSKGRPYNIVFFRKGTPGSTKAPMPEEVYSQVKNIDKGDVKRRYRVIGVKPTSPEKVYTGGVARLQGRDDQYSGLMKTGSERHTAYGTFRIVTINSKGWIYPGVPAAPVFQKMSQRIQPEIKKILQEGLMIDVEAGNEYLKANL